MSVRNVMLLASLVLLVCRGAPAEVGRQYTREQLAGMSAEQLVREYSRTVMRFDVLGQRRVEEAILKDPRATLVAIAKVVDEYDPSTRQGRGGGKTVHAYWALGLLSWIDNNHLRVRATEEGRTAIRAYSRVLERKRAAGHHEGKAGEGKQFTYKADLSEYESLNGANACDEQISSRLQEVHAIRIEKDELRRFSDFLTAKDPTYPSWSTVGQVENGRRRILDIEPYYRAYLQFKDSSR